MKLKSDALKKAGLGVGIVYAAAYALQSARIRLNHFSPAEFGLWWPLINPALLLNLDKFRELLGAPVAVSPALGAIGRLPGPGVLEDSQHIPSPLIDAIDILIPVEVSLTRAYNVARQVGFHGVGLYPDWQPRHGLHLDMRQNKTAANPALWSAQKVAGVQTYGVIGAALS